MTKNLGIVDTKKIIAAIKQSSGVDLIDYTLTTLRNRFSKALTYYNINIVDDFVEQIKDNNISFKELNDQLMIDSTELFRDPSLWRELREKYLPEIANTPGSKIWMAGISSGEELYSLMILLHETELKNKIRVVASCPSQLRIERIREGGGFDLKKTELSEANYKRLTGKYEFSNYYKIQNSKIQMDSSLITDIDLNNLNISQETHNNSYRLIIFRNILIQYNLSLYEKTLRRLIDCLTVGGYLIIGNKETLEHSEVGKKMQLVNKAEKIYRKRIN